MIDKRISATTTASSALWVAGGALVILGGFFSLWFTGAGLWLSGWGGVLTIRSWFLADDERLRNAFELGADFQRERNSPRRITSR